MSIPGSASPLFFTAAAEAAAAGPIKSVRFNSDDSAYLNRTPSSASNRKTWTWSGWVKRSSLTSSYENLFSSGDGGNNWLEIGFTSQKVYFYWQDSSSGTNIQNSDSVHRDCSAWMHLVVAVDTTQSSASDRLKIYVNGSQITMGGTNPTQDFETAVNNTFAHGIGSRVSESNLYFDGYLADIYFIDGQALDPTDFGAFDDNGVWQAAAYSGTYGTNGFHLFDFANESGIGNDSSGNDNDFTVNNISSTAGVGNDVLFDVPTNGDSSDDTGAGGEVSGNYATFNALMATSEFTYADGNLETSFDAGDNNITVSTIAPKSGKWYAEIVFTASGVANNFYGEVAVADASKIGQGFNSSTSTRYREGSADIYGAGTATGTKSDFAVGDVMGVAVDADNDTVYFYKNNTLEGTVTSLGFDGYAIGVAGNSGTGRTFTAVANYGQRSWVYSAPSGYSPLCTALLPTPTIADGSDYFDAKLYTGNGSTQTISGLGFSPDLVWIKNRAQADNHKLLDTVRGATEELESNTTDAEVTNTDGLTAFNSDGFDLGADVEYNTNTESYVAWTWDAGSSTASNTDGSVTSQVRVNQTAGFSIVSWTSSNSASGTYDSIGHGLNASPGLVITKRRTVADSWYSAHGFDLTQFAKLNSTDGFSSAGAAWGSGITSSVIGMRIGNFVNPNEAMIAYCFAPVAGYSAFGSYEGNGSTDGPFIYTGFRPKWVMYKSADTAKNWQIQDTERDSDNPVLQRLSADLSDAEYTGTSTSDTFDALSNGFKIRGSNNGINQSSTTYIYAAFAENPFQANGGLAR